MTTRTILLKDHESRALLAGATLLVRPVKPQPPAWCDEVNPSASPLHWLPRGPYLRDTAGVLTGKPLEVRMNDGPIKCPFGHPGDVLIGKEGWRFYGRQRVGVEGGFQYRCDLDHRTFTDFPEPRAIWDAFKAEWDAGRVNRWRSPQHLPAWASRHRLTVQGVACKRVKEITEKEAQAAGVERVAERFVTPGSVPVAYTEIPFRDYFEHQFNRDHGKGAWERNDFAWFLTIRRSNDG